MNVYTKPNLTEVNVAVPTKRVRIDDVEVTVEELAGLLESLENTDGFFTAVRIYDEQLRKKLESLRVIDDCGRRGCRKGENLSVFKKDFYELVLKESGGSGSS